MHVVAFARALRAGMHVTNDTALAYREHAAEYAAVI